MLILSGEPFEIAVCFGFLVSFVNDFDNLIVAYNIGNTGGWKIDGKCQ